MTRPNPDIPGRHWLKPEGDEAILNMHITKIYAIRMTIPKQERAQSIQLIKNNMKE